METSVKITYRKLSELSPHPDNPRVISNDDFANLRDSIQEDPLYFETRPIICSNRTGELVIIAGEKRYLAAKDLDYTEVPTAIIPNLSKEDELRILFKDNGSFGEWDWVQVKNNSMLELSLSSWGVDVPDFLQSDISVDEIETLSDNSFMDSVNSTDTLQLTFTFNESEKENIEEYLSRYSKADLKSEILKTIEKCLMPEVK